MSEDFRYKVKTYTIFEQADADAMAKDIEKMFNDGWKQTTNGPCLATPMTKMTSNQYEFKPAGSKGGPAMQLRGEPVEATTWLVMYVFAKEKVHGTHVN